MRGAYETITVWNRWRNPHTHKDQWYRHIVPKCSWELQSVRIASGNTASVSSVTTVIVAANDLYRNPREWRGLEEDEKPQYFTLAPGDLVALGEQTAEITGITPFTESDVRQNLAPDAFTIKSAQDNSAVPKQGAHFYLEGV